MDNYKYDSIKLTQFKNNECFTHNNDLNVYELFIDDKWKFPRRNFPKEILRASKEKILQEKIWFIKHTIRMKTYYNDKKKQIKNYKKLLPRDLCIFKSCLTQDELEHIYIHLEKIFSEYRDLNIIYSYQKSRGLTYLFTGEKQETQYCDKTLIFLKSYNKHFYKLIKKILYGISVVYNIKIKDLYKKTQFVPLKYEKDDGIWLHIDNVARYDQGPIMTISIGPKITYVDFVPSLLYDLKLDDSHDEYYKPLRFEINEGQLLIMDGSSRMEWAHGLPYNVPYEKTKYTLMFKCDKFSEQRKITNKILNTTITTSKNLCT